MAHQLSGLAELAYALGEDEVVKVGGRRTAPRRRSGARRSTGGPLAHDGGMELFQLVQTVTERLATFDLDAAIYTARARNVLADRMGEPARSYVELVNGRA